MQDGCEATTVEAGCREGRGRDLETPSLDDLENEIAELGAHIDAATWGLLAAIREFDRREGWSGFASCAHWLSYRIGTPPTGFEPRGDPAERPSCSQLRADALGLIAEAALGGGNG